MAIKTTEDNFDYQIEKVFDDMESEYKEDQKQRKEDGDNIETFSDWLWKNRDDFGEKVYNRFDEYTGIDKSTENRNYK